MRDTFVKTLVELSEININIFLVTGDLGFGVLTPFWNKFPERFINAGIAEQAMMGMAAGMALEGKTVFVYSIANFPSLRCLEQIRNDCAYHNANVKIVCVGAGFAYGAAGMSHHATEDAAILRALPGVSIITPSDPFETAAAVRAIAETPGTFYLRLGRGGEKDLFRPASEFQIGKGIKIFDGEKVVFLTAGAIVSEVLKAHEALTFPALYTLPSLKPMDTSLIQKLSKEYDIIVTVEEHNVVGGLGSAVAETMAEMPFRRARLLRIGLEDVFSSIVGDQEYLRKQYGFSEKIIVQKVLAACKEKGIL